MHAGGRSRDPLSRFSPFRRNRDAINHFYQRPHFSPSFFKSLRALRNGWREMVVVETDFRDENIARRDAGNPPDDLSCFRLGICRIGFPSVLSFINPQAFARPSCTFPINIEQYLKSLRRHKYLYRFILTRKLLPSYNNINRKDR